MKDFKFKDIKGMENVQYFNQLDTFEARETLASFDNRWLFDISIENPTIVATGAGLGDADVIIEGTNLTGSPEIKNLAVENGQYVDSSLVYDLLIFPKDIVISNTNNPFAAGSGSITNPTALKDYPLTKKVDNETSVYEFNEDAMFYIKPNPAAYVTRSGYFEISFKTTKQNCFVASGSSTGNIDFVKRFYSGSSLNDPSYVDDKFMYLSENTAQLSDLILNIKNGKLELTYRDQYGDNQKTLTFNGNATVSDGEWHHIVVNLGKPGTIREHGYKYNNRFIEMWVDGQLDFRTTEYINKEQMYFPFINYLLTDPDIAKQFDNIEDNGWETYDVAGYQSGSTNSSPYAGLNEFEKNIWRGIWNDKASQTAFAGAIDTIAIGMNKALSKFQIKQRYRLWRGFDKAAAKSFTGTATFVNPAVSTNKKKALKLFWNNLINENAKNGIELDNNFDVESYSITHKLVNSSTEVNNIDLANKKEIKFLADVKVALTDNVVLWGPGKDNIMNNAHTTDVTSSTATQYDARNMFGYDELFSIYQESTPGMVNPNFEDFWTNRYIINLPFSGITLNTGDRILLTNQFNKSDNGIYVFNGLGNLLTRAEDAASPAALNNAVVRIIDGYYKDTSWIMQNTIESLINDQNWIQLEYHPDFLTLASQPLFGARWTTSVGKERFINLEEDLNISKYDVVVFMNYPDTNEEIAQNFIGYDAFEINVMYQDFLKSLQNIVANGASLFVSSSKLAIDLGLVQEVEYNDQMLEDSDYQSANITPFEINEDGTEYFDTHRINQYHLVAEVPGLTDKETYILTDFINYVPTNVNKLEQYHAKYAYKQFGLQEGNEFYIPSLALRKATENDKLPGFAGNRKGTKQLCTFEPHHINAGTIVTKMQNTYYNGETLLSNEHDDDVTTFIVHNGQMLNGQPINGKIFVNCIEDHYTMSREEYNKAIIQNVTIDDINEDINTIDWQYSTTRLNRVPRKVNVRQLTEFGQTTPTNGGGGPLIQAPSNSSNGVIRSQTDAGNKDYQSDLYTTVEEERYETTEIPVLSMTWLGLQWLAE
jgi:hypothetical protein